MASEGLDTESGCLQCRSRNIQPITVTAENEPCGNPGRVVRYCCFNCNSVLSGSTLYRPALFHSQFYKQCVLPLLVHLPRSVSQLIQWKRVCENWR